MIRDFIKTRALFGVSFIVGVGYIMSSINFGFEKINIFLRNLCNVLSLHFLNFTPAPNFLADVAAFEAVVIALAIPLSFEIVSRISERYQSEVISKRFIHEWEIKWLPRFLIANIILAVTLRFFVDSEPTSTIWKIFAWITFGGFLFIAIILLKFFAKLKWYMTDTEFVLNKLYDEAEKLLKW